MWKSLIDGADEHKVAGAIMENYNISEEDAHKEAREFIKKLIDIGCLE